MSTQYLVDTSALARVLKFPAVLREWHEPLVRGLVGRCLITEIEFLFSAQSAADRAADVADMDSFLTWVDMRDKAMERAWKVQQQLTAAGKHRSAGVVDLVVAATAELAGLTVLHYDRDFETIAEVTGQPTQWLAQPGSLN